MLYENAKAELRFPPQAISFVALAAEAGALVSAAAGLLLII